MSVTCRHLVVEYVLVCLLQIELLRLAKLEFFATRLRRIRHGAPTEVRQGVVAIHQGAVVDCLEVQRAKEPSAKHLPVRLGALLAFMRSYGLARVGLDAGKDLRHVGACVRHLSLHVLTLSQGLHLVLYLLQDGGRRGGHAVKVLGIDLGILVRDVLFNVLNEEVHVALVLQCGLLVLAQIGLVLQILLLLKILLFGTLGRDALLAAGGASTR